MKEKSYRVYKRKIDAIAENMIRIDKMEDVINGILNILRNVDWKLGEKETKGLHYSIKELKRMFI